MRIYYLQIKLRMRRIYFKLTYFLCGQRNPSFSHTAKMLFDFGISDSHLQTSIGVILLSALASKEVKWAI